VLIGLDKIYVEGATGELHTNYEGKAEAALEILKTHDFAAVHIEAPDECTHMGDTKGKVQAIEWIDSRVLEPIVKRLQASGEDFRMLIISDHKTLTSTRGHDGSPVPYIIYDSRIDMRAGLSFCEADAALGRYVPAGTELMDILFD
jgi:2,3-bisphosphoglycerate-independent phosphoglycerate mutase